MLIGVPKEIKNHEYRVGFTPSMVKTFITHGHKILVETKAGEKIGFSDDQYREAGATVVPTAAQVYEAEMIVKVKEPQASEIAMLKEGQILFCYLHLAPDPEQTKGLLEKKVVGIAYETVTNSKGQLPLLTPMSEIAGRIAVQAGSNLLYLSQGGKGIILGGIPGVAPAKVVVIGGGVVGTQALRMALGLGADVTVIDSSLDRLRELDALYGPALKTLYSTPVVIEEQLAQADLVIGAVLVAGKKAPRLITREMVQKMQPGSVIVDVAIDQGGIAETSIATTHSDPTYMVNGVIHYCVANMPGACARSATIGLTNATTSYALKIANKGYKKALKEDSDLMNGLNVCLGKVTNEPVAQDLGLEYVSPISMLA